MAKFIDLLSPKQQMFVREYLVDLNATAAYIRAGYSAATADTNAPALMGKHRIKAAVDEAIDERNARVEHNQDKTLDVLANMAYGDIRELFYGDGTMKPLYRLTKAQAQLIASVETFSRNRKDADGNPVVEQGLRVRFVDRRAAAVDLLRHQTGSNAANNLPPSGPTYVLQIQR